MKEKSFKLCLTMAGAVSAGAYTAGVLDELFDILDRWEKAKQRNRSLGTDHPGYDHSLPMHHLELEVMSGASAGGINAALCLHKILDTTPSGISENTVLKNCWVNMADDKDGCTLEKLLNTDDLNSGTVPLSLLNGNPLEALADRFFTPVKKTARPSWFSEQAEILLTTTNLEGLPVNIHFEQADKEKNGHQITQHSSVFRFRPGQKFKNTPETDFDHDAYFTLDITREKDLEYLKQAALSTSAFPIGLPSRKVKLPHKPYLRFAAHMPPRTAAPEPNPTTEDHAFNSIDGGLLNNEPYGWGVRLLKEKCLEQYQSNRYAVIMIDPLPNKDAPQKKEKRNHFLNIAIAMFRALRNEVMLNPEGLAEAISLRDRTKFLIAPTKGADYPRELNQLGKVLASSPLSGFAGFIDKKQREHDYELGRRNCRDFIRFHFTVTLDDAAQRLQDIPSEEMAYRFGIYPYKNTTSGKLHYPLIPDIRLSYARENTLKASFKDKDEYPKLPVFSMEEFRKKYESLITRRMHKLVTYTTGKWWIGLGFRIFFLPSLRTRFLRLLDREMNFYTPYHTATKKKAKPGNTIAMENVNRI
ncbi:patatin-like phospholipase family protein [Robertkochia flava]|uniref:patatin-like phospholipase family protein n=1 Tax=Robertkochia flava TaxID=3447986 RepID=UPI001CD0208A|nr:patatin-like phospholipase family protein [Robertkochia marina]